MDDLLDPHPVLGKRTGLIGTNHRNGPHRFAGVHLAHQVIRLQHPTHRQRQRERDTHRQPLRNSHHDQSHRNHKNTQQLLGSPDPIARRKLAAQVCLGEHRYEDRNRHCNTDLTDHPRKTRQLLIQRRRLFAGYGRLLGYPPRFGAVAHSLDDHLAVTVHDGRTAQQRIGRIGRLGIEKAFVGSLVHLRLARQRRFIDLERYGLHQLTVRRDRFAILDIHQVAHDHIASGHLGHLPVADDLDRNVVIHQIEPLEPPHGVQFEEKADTSGQNDGADNSDGFQELPIDKSHRQRQQRRYQQYLNNRIAELLGKQFPGRIPLAGRDEIIPMQTAALLHLGGSQTSVLMFFHKVSRIYK